MKITIPKAQYIINEHGEKTAVLLSLAQYHQLLEDLHDLGVIAARRDEPPVTLEEIKRKVSGHGRV